MKDLGDGGKVMLVACACRLRRHRTIMTEDDFRQQRQQPFADGYALTSRFKHTVLRCARFARNGGGVAHARLARGTPNPR